MIGDRASHFLITSSFRLRVRCYFSFFRRLLFRLIGRGGGGGGGGARGIDDWNANAEPVDILFLSYE